MNELTERRLLVTKGNMWKALLILTIPVALNNFFNALYKFINTLFVANIGGMELAAVVFVDPINNVIAAASQGLAIGGTSLIGREIGREDYEKSKETSLLLIAISVFLGSIITFVCFIFSNQILIGASATEKLLHIANIYFKIQILSIPFQFLNASYFAIKRADADTKRFMIISFISMIVKIIVAYIMIFKLGIGVISLAVSTIIGFMVITLYAVYDLFIRKTSESLSFKQFKIDKNRLITLFKLGIPVMAEKMIISYSFVVVNKYVLMYGEEVLAAYGVTNKINSLIFSTVTGFGTGLATIVSQNLGANQPNRTREGIKKAFIIGISTSAILITIVLLFKYPIASTIIKNDKVILYHTINAMSVYSISVIPWSIFQIVIGIFEGTGHTNLNLMISAARAYLFRVPIVIILSKFSSLQEYSIWYAMLLSNIFTALFAMALYLRKRKNLELAGE